METTRFQFVCLIIGTALLGASGHAWLDQPPGRSSAWRFGFKTPVNYNDNELSCGGFDDQHNRYGGRCGLCGDPYGGPRRHEPGPDNVFATGVIVANYSQGQSIAVKIKITAPHKGYHEFRLCKNNVRQTGKDSLSAAQCDPASPSFPMLRSPDGRVRFDEMDPAIVLQLPADVTCEACILQWRWRTGNRWGCDAEGCGLGYGPQEEFYGCADVRIAPSSAAAAGTSRVSGSTTPLPMTRSRETPSPPAAVTATVATASAGGREPPVGGGTVKLACLAVPPYGADVANWCNVMCNAAQASCPASHCRCVRTRL